MSGMRQRSLVTGWKKRDMGAEHRSDRVCTSETMKQERIEEKEERYGLCSTLRRLGLNLRRGESPSQLLF